jgi:RNA-dependent RNA polymerase
MSKTLLTGSFGTRDRGCIKLAELCSIAVDYPKSGIPVNMADTPRFLIPYKPDWKSDEVINPRRTDYYESTRAIGYLFRAINLEDSTKELYFDPKTSDLKDKPKASCQAPPVIDAISSTLGPIVENHLRSIATNIMADTTGVSILFSRYLI